MKKATKSHNTTLFARALPWLAGLLVGLFVVSLALMAVFVLRHKDEPEVIGVSFSQVQAERYGIDWREAYTAVLTDLGFRHVRIATYWDRIEKSPGEYDFSELDFMVDEAARYNTKLKLVVGQKVIRVPECYYPTWLDRENADEVANRANLLIRAVTERYKDNPAIETWQLENEFLLKTFGECPEQNLSNERLQTELETLRSVDVSRPVELTQSNQFGFPFFGPNTEQYGFSMYRTVWNSSLGYFVYPQTGTYNWWKAALIEAYRGTNVTIHELQGEAWGKVGNEYLPIDEAYESMSPEKLADNVAYARSTQIKTMYLWGAEWWYWLKVKQGEPGMWQAASAISK